MKTIKVERVLLDSVCITNEAFDKYPGSTLKKLKAIVADVTKNNVLCDSLNNHNVQFQYAENYSVIARSTANSKIFEFYHDEIVVINE